MEEEIISFEHVKVSHIKHCSNVEIIENPNQLQ